ncbi:hypothetical protein [Anaerosinus massiliensis]|uniref:hypothetical protein n=1 Tax=Massilibacillus massiliensis TaxID=1806837 RepID=UPI000DA6028C|nr:hypothetical protein [Massilibacillus massiliensis]
MKKVWMITMVLLLAYSNLVFAAPSESEVVASFKSYVDQEVKKAMDSYKGQNWLVFIINKKQPPNWLEPPFWRIVHFTVNGEYTIDLRKNDSLIRPYVGILKIDKVNYYEDFSSQEAAAQCDSPKYRDTDHYTFSIAYQEDKWVVTKVELQYDGEQDTNSIYDVLKLKPQVNHLY